MKTFSLRIKLLLSLALLACCCPGSASAQQNTYWWNDAVFYEIFVRSFYDSGNDGIGDLKGLTQKLDYLNDGNPATTNDLGVTGIWLMPISQSPSYHGYDVTDYRSIEPDYGTMEDFRAFLDAAHARGISVIIDFVMNHSSSQHPWFINSASSPTSTYRNWYIWRNQHPGYVGPWGQQVWHFQNGAYYFGLFWSGMPDLNYENQDVKNEMFDVAKFWLDSLNIDGFRLDAIKHIFEEGPVMEDVSATFNFLEEFRQYYKNVNPNAMTVGEAWSGTDAIKKYSDGTKVDFCFEYPSSWSTINSVNAGLPNEIRDHMQTVLESYPYLQYAPFLSNHDNNRVFEQLGQELSKMKLAAAIYLTLPGIPFMYYGEEVGMIGSGPDENKRKPMQWSSGANAGFTTGSPWYPINSNYVDFNVSKMQADKASLWHWYRQLIAARNQHAALRRGDYATVSADVQNLYAYARRTVDEVIIVVHNFRNQAVSNPALALGESTLTTGVHGVQDILSGNDLGTVLIENNGGFSGWRPSLTLPARATALLSISTTATAIETEEEILPAQFSLGENFPNPFNPQTTIPYSIGANGHSPVRVSLKIFDVSGREVSTLVDERQAAGEYKINWNPKNLASGVYFYRLQAGEFVETKKMIFLQ
jgi:glycosidase